MTRVNPKMTLTLVAVLMALVAAGCGDSVPTIGGEIRIAPELGVRLSGDEVLVIIASGSSAGPPLAVQRIRAPDFPLRYYLSEADKMNPTAAFAGQLTVVARLDADGRGGPAQRGDLEGSASAALGDQRADIVINKRISSEASPAADRPSAAAAGAISGEVRLASELAPGVKGTETLFLIARGSMPGPPLAVQRIASPKFPLRYRLTEADKMVPTLEFAGPVTVTARLDADGRAGPAQPGDLEGSASATIGDANVTVVISKRFTSPSAPPFAPPPAGRAAEQPAAGAGAAISGEISIAPELAGYVRGSEVLYLFARGNKPGPPLAVQRIASPKFPLRYRLTEADKMMPELEFTGAVTMVARLDADGSAGAGQAGDFEGVASASVGDSNVRIVIDKRY